MILFGAPSHVKHSMSCIIIIKKRPLSRQERNNVQRNVPVSHCEALKICVFFSSLQERAHTTGVLVLSAGEQAEQAADY